MVVFLWRLLTIYLLKVFLDVRGIIAWSWKWANFFWRSFFITAEEQANFFGRPFFITAKERGDFFGRPSLITSMLLLLFIFWLSCLIFLIYVWLALVWESLSAYTRLRVFSHLATFGWLTSSFGASSAIYIGLAESCPFFFFGDLHPFKESCHLGFVSDLHSSWQTLIT